jgi:hypothetical protein
MSRSRWGPVTWYFLHSFAEKVDDSVFIRDCEEIKSILHDMFSVLPCPVCSQHAIKYIKSSNFHHITRRGHLQSWLFEFHNSVSERLKKPVFSATEHLALYPRADFGKIYDEFITIFAARRSEHVMMDVPIIRRTLARLREWMRVNRHTFGVAIVPR